MTYPAYGLQIQSIVRDDSTVALQLGRVPVRAPDVSEVVVRMEAAPINPSDLGTMFAGATYDTVRDIESSHGRAVAATLPPTAARSAAARTGRPVVPGGEGAGVVVAAGTAAQHLVGRTVALRGEAYCQYRTLDEKECLVLAEGTRPEQAAACFINPLTVLGIVETMHVDGHTSLVNTAAGSNLGQMLQRLCITEEIPLVNLVRSDEAVAALRSTGAEYIVNTTSMDFESELTDALAATGATVAFDATGGGELAGTILAAMEQAQARTAQASGYGTSVYKQVYIYGALEQGPTTLYRRFGMAWGVGGWLLTHFLNRIGEERTSELKRRVAANLDTIFASTYTKVVTMSEALTSQAVSSYSRKSTAGKYLIAPHRS